MGRYGRYRKYDDYRTYRPTPPIQARGGIATRSQRGDIGDTWWSQRFVHVLESFGMGARLTRGRRYARMGQVLELQVEAGQVSATVQGSRRRPYQVSLSIPVIGDEGWARVTEALSAQAMFLAQLLAGRMPEQIEQTFDACRLPLFPGSRYELDTSCTCPDWANPCKHVAAALYILAEQFDEDPFLILSWRGRSREQLLGDLRLHRPAEEQVEPTRNPLDLERFWGVARDWQGEPLHPEVPATPEAALRERGALPAEAQADRWLSSLYEVLTRSAQARAFDDEQEPRRPTG